MLPVSFQSMAYSLLWKMWPSKRSISTYVLAIAAPSNLQHRLVPLWRLAMERRICVSIEWIYKMYCTMKHCGWAHRFVSDSPDVNSWFGPESHNVGSLLKKDNLTNNLLGTNDNEANASETIQPPRVAPVAEAREFWKGWNPVIVELLNAVDDLPK